MGGSPLPTTATAPPVRPDWAQPDACLLTRGVFRGGRAAEPSAREDGHGRVFVVDSLWPRRTTFRVGRRPLCMYPQRDLTADGGVRVLSLADLPEDREQAVSALFVTHWDRLVRLATLLVDDRQTAEEVVQDAFVATYERWGRLRDTTAVLGYLQRCVVNGSRSRLRRRGVARRGARAALGRSCTVCGGGSGVPRRGPGRTPCLGTAPETSAPGARPAVLPRPP